MRDGVATDRKPCAGNGCGGYWAKRGETLCRRCLANAEPKQQELFK